MSCSVVVSGGGEDRQESLGKEEKQALGGSGRPVGGPGRPGLQDPQQQPLLLGNAGVWSQDTQL